MPRDPLPSPASLHDIYMHDQCVSLRMLIDILTPKQPEPQATVELREPEKPKLRHRDQLLEYEAKAVEQPEQQAPTQPPAEITGAVQVEPPRKAQRGPERPAEKRPEQPAEPVVPRRQAKPS